MNAFRLVAFTLLLPYAFNSLAAADLVRVVSAEEIPGSRQPRVAIDQNGHVFVAFGSNDGVYVSRSVDRGRTFASPQRIGHVEKLALGRRRGPRISAFDGSVVVTAIGHGSGDLMAWHSLDSGETWSDPTVVNDVPSSAREGLHGMAVGPNGFLFCTWLDLRNESTQIYGARSTDGGETWGENRLVYASPSGTVCECCHPSVAIDRQGVVYVMWRNVLDGNRDMYVARSANGERTFDLAIKLGTGTWELDACPMDGGDMAITPAGGLVTIWRRNRQVFAARLDEVSEQQLGLGEQPSVAATNDGLYWLWISRRGGDLLLSRSTSSELTIVATDASDPVISTARSGDGPVVAVWESGREPNRSIVATVLRE